MLVTAALPPRPTPDRRSGPLRLGLLTGHDVTSPTAFSGTVFHATRALAAHPGVALSVFAPPPMGRIARRLGWPERPTPLPDPAELGRLDALVGLVASDLIDRLPGTSVPILHVTDATPRFLAQDYGWDISEAAFDTEARVARRATLSVYSSAEMAARARTELGVAATAWVPFGTNMPDLPSAPPPTPGLGERIELVFVGRDWRRKGGDIALAALDALGRAGRAARLTVVGDCPDDIACRGDICAAGPLDPGRATDRARLSDFYRRAQLMILPTRADCTPMVVAEAMAHGTPVLATRTGGMGSLVTPGTGVLMSPDAGGEEWARAILDTLRDPFALEMMADAAFDRARTRLTWTAWAEDLIDLARRAGLHRTDHAA